MSGKWCVSIFWPYNRLDAPPSPAHPLSPLRDMRRTLKIQGFAENFLVVSLSMMSLFYDTMELYLTSHEK